MGGDRGEEKVIILVASISGLEPRIKYILEPSRQMRFLLTLRHLCMHVNRSINANLVWEMQRCCVRVLQPHVLVHVIFQTVYILKSVFSRILRPREQS